MLYVVHTCLTGRNRDNAKTPHFLTPKENLLTLSEAKEKKKRNEEEEEEAVHASKHSFRVT